MLHGTNCNATEKQQRKKNRITDDIQTTSGDHKMVAPELDGGGLTGSSSALAAGLRDDDGEVDEGLRTTAKLCGYSMVDGVAWELNSVFPNSDEIPTVTKSTIGAPTTMGKQGVSFGILRAGQGR